MAYYALVYHTAPDYLARRAEYRADHLALAQAAHARGELLLAGAYQNPPDAALLVWKCADRAPIEAFVAADPYVRNGLVTRWEIRDWYVVIADDPMPV
ncbi:MAG TPA: YciI-like protein [Kofleriaceae bacterium]|jgi:uncharacterized protein YciI|nr:YciI-like protein [Kofleriaceae bacterium]